MKATPEQIFLAFNTFATFNGGNLDSMEAALNAVFASMEYKPKTIFSPFRDFDLDEAEGLNLNGRVFWEENKGAKKPLRIVERGDLIYTFDDNDMTCTLSAKPGIKVDVDKGNQCSEDGKHYREDGK